MIDAYLLAARTRLVFTAAPALLALAACSSEPASEPTGGAGDGAGSATETMAPAATTEETQAARPPAAPEEATVAPAAAPARPPVAFTVCRGCHSVEPGRNIVGPTLNGIMGSKAGEVDGYPFSPALKSSGIVWTRESLDEWLQGPMKMVPGTKMVMSVPNAEAREAIIDYLETLD